MTIGISIERVRSLARQMHEGIIAYAREHGDISLRIIEFEDLKGTETVAKCDGYIAQILNERFANTLRLTRKPIVNLYCEKDRPGIFNLVVDKLQHRIGVLAARHFLKHRFTQFAFCGLDGLIWSDTRRDAFSECLRRHHYMCHLYKTPSIVRRQFNSFTLLNNIPPIPVDQPQLSRWLKSLPKPIGIFCVNDSRAYQVSQVCRLCNIRVPEEIAVLGVDDDDLICNYAIPPLSSINQNGFGIGYAAMRTLCAMIEQPQQQPPPVRLKLTGLTTRGSTNTYPLNPSWLSDALVFIRRNINRNLSAADVYAAVGKSHTIVDRAFMKILGTSVKQTIIRFR